MMILKIMKITTFSEYQKEANFLKISMDKFLELHPETPSDVKLLLAVAYDGLGMGEAGETQGKIKKIIRDAGGIITAENITEIKKELGDQLWYIASMCDSLGLKLEDVASANIEKLQGRRDRGTLHGSGDNR
jgi:NTP pyrophosphatase (non-canonical NTP hydrolase)